MTKNGHAYNPRMIRKQEPKVLRATHRRTADEAKLPSATLVYLDPVDIAARAFEEGRQETLQLLARIKASGNNPKILARIQAELNEDLEN